jgi:hypothetical protein
VLAPNQCGACTSDVQCAGDPYYSAAGKTLCDTVQHTCVSATCATSLAACDGAHLCCGTTCEAGSTFAATGNNKSCCSANDCAGNVGFTACVNNQCSACAAVTNGAFYVDPANGTDNGSSGGDSAGCRFKTLAHAISVASLTAGTKTIYLIGDDNPTTNTSESFPLAIPPNTTLAGYDDTGAAATMRTVFVPAGRVGFKLTGNNSSLHHLTIDGVNGATTVALQRYNIGIVIGSSTAPVPSGIALDHVTVTDSLAAGITIGGMAAGVPSSASVTLGAGMKVNNVGFLSGTLANGTTGASPGSGLVIGGKSTVTINGGADQSSFSNNSAHGIIVANRAGLTINGSLASGNGDYTGSSVIANGNNVAGLIVMQNPAGATTAGVDWTNMPTCNITGLVSINSSGNGIRLEGGSKVTLRKSVSYGNAGDGVHVEAGPNALTGAQDANYIGALDLGTAANAGGNLLQVPYGAAGATYNHGAGICLAIAAAATKGQKLNALGNTLVTTTDATVDCAAAGGTVVHNDNNCRSGAGAPASLGVTPAKANTNTIDITTCK